MDVSAITLSSLRRSHLRKATRLAAFQHVARASGIDIEARVYDAPAACLEQEHVLVLHEDIVPRERLGHDGGEDIVAVLQDVVSVVVEVLPLVRNMLPKARNSTLPSYRPPYGKESEKSNTTSSLRSRTNSDRSFFSKPVKASRQAAMIAGLSILHFSFPSPTSRPSLCDGSNLF